MALLQAVAIAAIALILTPGWQFYFDVTPKVVVLLIASAALVVWHAWLPVNSSQRWFTVILILSAVSLVLSSALSKNPTLSLFGTSWRRFGAVEQCAVLLFIWLVAQHAAGRPERVRTVLRGVAIAGIAASFYGIAQYFGWDPILPKSAYHIGEGIWTIVRPPGTLGYASYFATWLVATAFLGAAQAALETGPAWRSAAWTSAVLSLAALFLNGTRAALLGLAAGAAIWLWGRGFRHGRRVLASLAALAIVVAVFYVSPAGWQLRSRARWFAEDPWGGGRRVLWHDSLVMAAHRLPLGYGPEVFTAAFPAFESPRLARQYPDFSYESPHNMLLDALISQGIPGLMALSALCWIGFRAAWRSRHPAAVPLAAALAAGVASQQFTVSTMPTALLLFTTVALAVALASKEAAPSPPRLAGRSAAALAAAILLVVAVRLAAGDYALELTRRDLEARRLQEAATHFSQYDRWRLPGTAADLWYSRQCAAIAGESRNPAAFLQAMSQYRFAALRATETAEEPFDAWYNASQYYAVRNDAAGVERSLQAAIAARPNWFKPHWTLARVLRLEQRLPDAEREASLATQLDGGAHPEVMATWAEIHDQRVTSVAPPLHK
jgi:O-antigen ligase